MRRVIWSRASCRIPPRPGRRAFSVRAVPCRLTFVFPPQFLRITHAPKRNQNRSETSSPHSARPRRTAPAIVSTYSEHATAENVSITLTESLAITGTTEPSNTRQGWKHGLEEIGAPFGKAEIPASRNVPTQPAWNQYDRKSAGDTRSTLR